MCSVEDVFKYSTAACDFTLVLPHSSAGIVSVECVPFVASPLTPRDLRKHSPPKLGFEQIRREPRSGAIHRMETERGTA